MSLGLRGDGIAKALSRKIIDGPSFGPVIDTIFLMSTKSPVSSLITIKNGLSSRTILEGFLQWYYVGFSLQLLLGGGQPDRVTNPLYFYASYCFSFDFTPDWSYAQIMMA